MAKQSIANSQPAQSPQVEQSAQQTAQKTVQKETAQPENTRVNGNNGNNGRGSQEQEPQHRWTIEKSEELYRIQGWGEPYFSINAAGRVTVSPQGDRGGSLDLYELVNA
ncbi:MAG: arginine decarboxylase, partial [Elainella sp.]